MPCRYQAKNFCIMPGNVYSLLHSVLPSDVYCFNVAAHIITTSCASCLDYATNVPRKKMTALFKAWLENDNVVLVPIKINPSVNNLNGYRI